LTFNGLHGTTAQKFVLLLVTAIKTLNSTEAKIFRNDNNTSTLLYIREEIAVNLHLCLINEALSEEDVWKSEGIPNPLKTGYF
jgi:hypothetical protein